MSAQSVRNLRWFGWILCTLLFVGGYVHAQQDSGGILVAVTDTSGATIRDANVTVTNEGTHSQLKGSTNDIGTWTATPLPPGNYRITVARSGFETAVVEHAAVEIQQDTRVPVSLKVGSVNENVVVTAQAPLLQTEDVSAGQTIGGVVIPFDDVSVIRGLVGVSS